MIIKIGTDCSGIEAPIQALKKMKVKFKHEFSSEIDKFAVESIGVNYDPKILFKDITKKRDLPKIDVYVCGFPCQSFSIAGKRRGSNDKRGNIFLHCIKAIKQTKPSLFILENVKGVLTIENGTYWKQLQKKLNNLKDYNIYWEILNTKDYGIPQNRERLFIIGLKKSKQKYEFNFPKKKKMRSIHSFVDKKIKNRKLKINWKDKYINKLKESKAVFTDITFIAQNSPNSYQTYSPTITANGYLWCVPMKRRATIKELLSLQGFPKNFKQVVSDTQLRKQIGNSMSVNVIVELFKECFETLGWK
jgi:DNA (cytosine-5)-methyltransferase 1